MTTSACKKCRSKMYLCAAHDHQSGEWLFICLKCCISSPHAKTYNDAVEAWNEMQKEEQENG